MPTGYTAGVQDGTVASFKDFAMTCARAFGACITLRDERLSPEIPEFTVDSYYSERLAQSVAELGEWNSSSPEAKIGRARARKLPGGMRARGGKKSVGEAAPRSHCEGGAMNPHEYHQRPELSHSQLEVFRRDPALYYGRFITKTIPGEDTEELAFGALFHDFLLLGGANIVEVPAEVLTSNGQRRGKAWDEFVAAHPGKELILPRQWAQLRTMRDEIMAHDDARRLMELPGLNEHVLKWTDAGVDCRAMLDRFCPGSGVIVDLKTSANADPQAFASSALKYGYHRQAAWYKSGAADSTFDDMAFLFIVVEKKPPYRVEVIELDQDFEDLGWQQNAADLQRWKACRDSGVWHTETWGKAITVGVPRWAKYAQEWEFANHGD